MQIDWFTVGVQIINFLILVALLKRFLYKPVIQAMDNRKKALLDQQEKADNEMKSAIKLMEQYQKKHGLLDRQREELIEQSRREVELERSYLMDRLREDIELKRNEWLAELENERLERMDDIKSMLVKESVDISRRALSDLAGIELETRMVEQFIYRLTHLPADEKIKLMNSAQNNKQVIIATHYDLDQQKKQAIKKCLKQLLNDPVILFERHHDIICGIVMETEGFNWSWRIDNYLDELEESLISGITPFKKSQNQPSSSTC